MKMRGITILETVNVIAVVGIMASALFTVYIPQMNTIFYFPVAQRVNDTAADLMEIIFEGNRSARGLRFTGPACTIPTGGSASITAATRSGGVETLTYRYADYTQCGSQAGSDADIDVALSYDSSTHLITRAVNGGSAVNIPYYAKSSADFKIDPIDTNFFRFYDSAGTEMSSFPLTLANIYRVDVAYKVTTGSANVKHNAGSVYLKSGVEIKRYTT